MIFATIKQNQTRTADPCTRRGFLEGATDLSYVKGLCHGMTKSIRKTNRLTKMLIFTILASFVCFFNFPDRNLIILYKITWKLPFFCKTDQMPLLRIHLLYQITQRTADLLMFSLFLIDLLDYCKDQWFVPIPFVSILALARQNNVRIHSFLLCIDALSSMPCCLPFTIVYSYA